MVLSHARLTHTPDEYNLVNPYRLMHTHRYILFDQRSVSKFYGSLTPYKGEQSLRNYSWWLITQILNAVLVFWRKGGDLCYLCLVVNIFEELSSITVASTAIQNFVWLNANSGKEFHLMIEMSLTTNEGSHTYSTFLNWATIFFFESHDK